MTTNIRYKLHLQWDDYDRLILRTREVDETARAAHKVHSWFTSLKDSASNLLSRPAKIDKLSNLSNDISTRLAFWAPLVTCAYTKGLRHLQVKLAFVTERVVADGYVYCGDPQLCEHVDLQLKSAYAIMGRYLKVSEPLHSTVRILELRRPIRANQVEHMSTYITHYVTDSATQVDTREGFPFSIAAFLTYELNEFE